LTIEGELIVDMDINADAGVIDLRAGIAADCMNVTPVRVLALSARRTLVSFVVIEAPDRTGIDCERRYHVLTEAAQELMRRFGGGELHAMESAAQFAEPGLN
jgi:hypothetical protein